MTTGESDIFSVAQKPDQCVERKHFRRARLGSTHKQFDPCAALDVAFSTGEERCGCCLCRQFCPGEEGWRQFARFGCGGCCG